MVETSQQEEIKNASQENSDSKKDKYVAFMEWCNKVGVVSGKL